MTFSTRPAGQIFGVGVSRRFLLLPVLLLLTGCHASTTPPPAPGLHTSNATVTVIITGN